MCKFIKTLPYYSKRMAFIGVIFVIRYDGIIIVAQQIIRAQNLLKVNAKALSVSVQQRCNRLLHLNELVQSKTE